MARVRHGDTVMVLSGKDRGKTGKILRVWPERDRALVERINLVKHFERRGQQQQAGGVIEREAAVPLAKLAPVCPRCRKPVRVGWARAGDGPKQRQCHRCHEAL